jgi:pectinesterase
MATRTGYGDALCGLFRAEVSCINLARGGRSTRSFRADGSWERVTALLREREANRATYVLIQFGHNDQPGKAERTTDLATEFPANLARYADELKEAGATAVLVTPLTRRTFRDGALVNDLEPWAEAVRRTAREKRLPLLDLNADSAAAVASMGSAEADMLAMAGEKDFDRTHLGAKGAELFSRMVARELAGAVPVLAPHLKTRPQLTDAQAAGYSYREVLKPWDPLSDPLTTAATPKPDYVVDAGAAADGRTTFNSVQAAVSAAVTAAAAGRRERIHIRVRPGVYRELVYVPPSAAPITLHGGGADAASTRISANLDAGVPGRVYRERYAAQFAAADPASAAMFASVAERASVGTAGSAVAWIRGEGFQAKNITFENAFNKDRGDWIAESDERVVQRQAVAMMVDGADRVQFENVRFIGFQDTLYLRSASAPKASHSFFNRSYVEGDMDFIFGDGTAYFQGSEIRSLGDRRVSYLLAPSTHALTRFGFVFEDCDFTHDGSPNALAGTFRLARQWPQGGSVDAVGKTAILRSRIGAHIDRVQPWADWGVGTPRYRPVRYGSDSGEPYLAEHRNTYP